MIMFTGISSSVPATFSPTKALISIVFYDLSSHIATVLMGNLPVAVCESQ